MGFKIPFGIDSSKFKSGLKDMRAGVKSFSDKVEGDLTGGNRGFLKMAGNIGLVTAGLTILGGLAVAAFVKISAKVKKLDNQAGETATGIEELQVLLQAAFKEGAEAEQLVAALKNIQSRSVDAANGAKQYQTAMARLNIDFEKFVNLPGERKLEQIAKGFVDAEDPAQAYRDVLMLLGEDAGPKLIKVLEDLGTKGFDSLNKKMRESGQIIDKEVIAGLKDAQKALDDFRNKMTTKGVQVGGFIANLFGSGSDADVDIARATLQDRIANMFTFGAAGSTFQDSAIDRQEEVRLAKERDAKNDIKIKDANNKRLGKKDKPKFNVAKFSIDMANTFGDLDDTESALNKAKTKKSSFKGVPVSSLQAIGGGGAVGGLSNAMAMDKQRNTLLQQIVENTGGASDGTGASNGPTLG